MLTKIKKLNNRIKKHNLRLIKSWIQIIYYTKIIKKFSVDEFFLYDLTNKTLKEKRKYNSIQKNKKLKYKYNSKSSINKIDNKGNFFQYYGDFIKRKQYVFSNNNDDFINTFDNQRKLFVKPTNECKGRGAHIIDLKTFNIEAEKQNYRNHIFEEIIIQNKAVEQINPSSVNTVRLVTIVDQNKEVHILRGVLRVGRDGNIVDNSGAGGLFSHINIDDGAIDTNFFDNNGKTFEKHPDTKFKIKGFKIPNFDLIY